VAATLGADEAAAKAIALLAERGLTLATAESLTGGLVAAALTSVPGASAVLRGGIVAYAADVKAALLSVPRDLLDRVGTVHAEVALAMASGVRDRLGASVGIGTTGVAGPEPVDGHPVGTVHIAVSSAARGCHRELRLSGDRQRIRHDTVSQALDLLVLLLEEDNE
jgi:nicotinamide-nucleotide amidase